MLNKSGKLYSILYNKCPKCHQGNFFTVNNHYSLRSLTKMEERCSVCGQSYKPEPGFYYGSTYVSYGINVTIFVMSWIVSELLLPQETSVWLEIAIIVGTGLLLVPLNFRFSRLIWINFFVDYDPRTVKKQ